MQSVLLATQCESPTSECDNLKHGFVFDCWLHSVSYLPLIPVVYLLKLSTSLVVEGALDGCQPLHWNSVDQSLSCNKANINLHVSLGKKNVSFPETLPTLPYWGLLLWEISDFLLLIYWGIISDFHAFEKKIKNKIYQSLKRFIRKQDYFFGQDKHIVEEKSYGSVVKGATWNCGAAVFNQIHKFDFQKYSDGS